MAWDPLRRQISIDAGEFGDYYGSPVRLCEALR